MGLEKLELENFKSYFGKHVVGPFDRFSCIVGPNGSGKSNIMDAITFCLGISSIHLRSNNVRTLIHSSCAYARVSLFIRHGREEKILRRHITTGGKSNYYIGDESISYEGFREFLESINILIHVRNFLVFQGDINSIASMTPMDLTKLFEEMSGSIELKEAYDKKLAAQNKALAECSSLFEEKKEILARMKEAKEVKEQEKMFRELIDKRSEIQRAIILHKLHSKTRQVNEMSTEISKLELQERNVQKLLDSKEREVDMCRSVAEEAQREYFEVENRISRQKELIREARQAQYENEEGKDRNEIRRMELELEIKNKEESKNEKERELRKKERELEAVEQGYGILCKKEEEREKRLSMLDEDREMIEEKEREVRRLTAKDQELLNVLDLEVFPNTTLRKHNIEKLKRLKEKEEELCGMIREKNIVKGNAMLKIAALERSECNLRERIASSESKYEKIVSEEKEKNNQLSHLLGEILRIKGQRKVNAKRSVVQSTVETLKTIFPGVYGRVVDLIRPTQNRYETALSMLLGSHDQSVVVDTEVTAISCINFIKDKRLCKITFLPLQNIKVTDEWNGADAGLEGLMNGILGKIKDLDKVVRPAIDTITYDPKYKKIVFFLFRNSLIADTIEVAKDICYGRSIKINICTLDGVYFHGRGYLITGGMIKESKFQENELDDLMKKRIKVLEELKEIQESKSALSHVEISRERMNVWKESRVAEMEILEKTTDAIGELEAKLKNNLELQSETEESLRGIEKELSVSKEAIGELTQKIETVELEVFFGIFPNSNFKSYREYKECKEDNTFAQRSMEYESIKRKVVFGIEFLKQEIRSLVEDGERIRDEIKELGVGSDVSPQSLSTLNKEFLLLDEEKRRRLAVFEKVGKELKDINDEFRTLVSKKNELDKSIIYSTSTKGRLEEEIKDSLNFAMLEEIEIPCVRRGVSIKEEHVKGIFSMDDIDFSGLYGTSEELTRELEQINQRINDQIPFIKMEEKNSDQARYMKVSGEYEQLKEIAVDAKKEFDEAKKRRVHAFMECFEKVNAEVARIYKSLTMTETSEGNAYLVLENTVEPFKEGVRFHLMPPNKRFREVKLLSGGEKTMAVLSLLFSFHSYRPAPFYVFDEIDSALDKVNVSKIIAFMISCDVQFIIITLKPMLFQHSDGLIGVYKDPHENVSKILTYKLNE